MGTGVTVFGPAWSKVLCEGSARLTVPVDWTLAKIALESGFNPAAKNASGARGLWQCMPQDMGRHEEGDTLPDGWFVKTVIEQKTNSTHLHRFRPYLTRDPVVQLREGIQFWANMCEAFNVEVFTSRAAFYCLNIAPARLKNGTYTDETILYSADPADKGEAWYWPSAYKANAGPFGLKPEDPVGKLRMKNLEFGLAKAVKRCQARYDAELEAAMVANVG